MNQLISQDSDMKELDVVRLPLTGSRLIEASAGTGKTYTIAALFVRLVLGHGENSQEAVVSDVRVKTGFHRALLPSEILVMTFTKAATQELSSRIQARLLEVAEIFRQDPDLLVEDAFVKALLESYPTTASRQQAAWQLDQAALCMDEASVFTIDAWCQKVLREHAIHTGQPFDEELVVNEQDLRRRAVQDFWRRNVYAMDLELARKFKQILPKELDDLNLRVEKHFKNQTSNTLRSEDVQTKDFVSKFSELANHHHQHLGQQKKQLLELQRKVSDWVEFEWTQNRAQWNGKVLGQHHLQKWLGALEAWCKASQAEVFPSNVLDRWSRFSPEAFVRARHAQAPALELPPFIEAFFTLGLETIGLPTLLDQTLPWVMSCISAEIKDLKAKSAQFGFSDLLLRLDLALKAEHGGFLRDQLKQQYPIIMVDEFQDTSPIQYEIFDQIYNIEQNSSETAILLIGDPKQSIYSFRGADINSYLKAKSATHSRQYVLNCNFRSSVQLVKAVNALFGRSEATRSSGAFSYRQAGLDPLPFLGVQAAGLKENLMCSTGLVPPITAVYCDEVQSAKDVREQFAAHCAEQVVTWLNDPSLVFKRMDGSGEDERRLLPADIAILVRTGVEAQAVRNALAMRGLYSVYLSDKDSVFKTDHARDMAYWMRAVLTPMDVSKVKTALALSLLSLSNEELQMINDDENKFDQYASWMKELEVIWRRQGILAMVRKTLTLFDLPARWLGQSDGQRKLTNVLQLSELLQAQSLKVHAQQGLLDWFIHALSDSDSQAEDHILRLESDADLVKIVTIHKSKGLEFNVVMLPFATTFNSKDQKKSNAEVDASEDEKIPVADDASKENIRLLYVALTRAKHAIWMGFARLNRSGQGACVTHLSALGTLITDGQALSAEESWLERLRSFVMQDEFCEVLLSPVQLQRTSLKLQNGTPDLKEPLTFKGHLDLDYRFSSFSSLLRQGLGAQEHKNLESFAPAEDEPHVADDDAVDVSKVDSLVLGEFALKMSMVNRLHSPNPWLGIAGGIEVGNYVHELLRWTLVEGFGQFRTEAFQLNLLQRIENFMPQKIKNQENLLGGFKPLPSEHALVGDDFWGKKSVMSRLMFNWLSKILYEPFNECGVALEHLKSRLAETEFWMSCDSFESHRIEAVASTYLLPDLSRQAVLSSSWHGMLMGFSDLLFESGGKYYVLDYKTNSLGFNLQDYEIESLQKDVVANRYDLQAAIYLLALHRLLRHRLSEAYDPDVHLGGAFVWYVRGVSSKGQGLCFLKASASMMAALEVSLSPTSAMNSTLMDGVGL